MCDVCAAMLAIVVAKMALPLAPPSPTHPVPSTGQEDFASVDRVDIYNDARHPQRSARAEPLLQVQINPHNRGLHARCHCCGD